MTRSRTRTRHRTARIAGAKAEFARLRAYSPEALAHSLTRSDTSLPETTMPDDADGPTQTDLDRLADDGCGAIPPEE